jgi:hypothetical protein
MHIPSCHSVSDSTLLLDGDFNCYAAAATVTDLSAAISRFYKLCLEDLFYTGCKKLEVYLTSPMSTLCNRKLYPSVKPYQANRERVIKPPLLAPLRHALRTGENHPDDMVIIWADDCEADDAIIMRGEVLYDKCVIFSKDKDLRVTRAPLWHYKEMSVDTIHDRLGWLSLDKSASFPILGHGTKFFWMQMLMGDPADNVRGIRLLKGARCGPIKAYDFLSRIDNDECTIATAVVSQYARINQDVLSEAECLWLRRSPDDTAYKYLCEVVKNEVLYEWITELHQYHAKILEAHNA